MNKWAQDGPKHVFHKIQDCGQSFVKTNNFLQKRPHWCASVYLVSTARNFLLCKKNSSMCSHTEFLQVSTVSCVASGQFWSFLFQQKINTKGYVECVPRPNYYFTPNRFYHKTFEFIIYLTALLVIIHNYTRLSYVLVGSLKETARLTGEGNAGTQ